MYFPDIHLLHSHTKVGSRGEYHPVSFSWIIGGIVERLHEKLHIADATGEIACLINHETNMYMGQLPTRVCLFVVVDSFHIVDSEGSSSRLSMVINTARKAI
jgi:hypothetical protein